MKEAAPKGKIGSSGIGRSISSGLKGEEITTAAVIQSIGGVRGILETLLPTLVYLTIYIFTENLWLSAVFPVGIALLAILLRILTKQAVIGALSGFLGVVIAATATLLSGRGEAYFLPGFWINGVWLMALTISVLIKRPLIGYFVGMISGDFVSWLANKKIFSAALISTLAWIALFVVRLMVQLPLYFAGNVAALGIARLTMGTPLFALLIIFTWLLFRGTGVKPDVDMQ